MNKINHKHQFYLSLLGAIVLVCFVTFKLTVPTISKGIIVIYSEEGQSVAFFENSLQLLQNELEITARSDSSGADIIGLQQKLIQIIGRFSENEALKLNALLTTHTVVMGDFIVANQIVELKSDYSSVVKLLDQLDKYHSEFQISSLKMYSKRNNKLKKDELFTELYVQSIL